MQKKEVKTTEENQFPVAVSLKKIVQKIVKKITGTWEYFPFNNGFKTGYIKTNWLTLTNYRKCNDWYGDTYQHTWREYKSIFSRKWVEYEHEYFLYSAVGLWRKPMSEQQFDIALERAKDAK